MAWPALDDWSIQFPRFLLVKKNPSSQKFPGTIYAKTILDRHLPPDMT